MHPVWNVNLKCAAQFFWLPLIEDCRAKQVFLVCAWGFSAMLAESYCLCVTECVNFLLAVCVCVSKSSATHDPSHQTPLYSDTLTNRIPPFSSHWTDAAWHTHEHLRDSDTSSNWMTTFTFMHLADAFIQSDLQCIQAIDFFCQYVCSLGIEPTTFALLTQCSTTEPQEHYKTNTKKYDIFGVTLPF